MIRVKVCGVKNYEIADMAIQQGAHALGFIFFENSTRYVSPEDAKKIIRDLPAFVSKVGVFVNQTVDNIIQTVSETGLDTIQLHGFYDRDVISQLRKQTALPIIYALRVEGLNNKIISELEVDGVNNYLVDKFSADQFGGTGQKVNIEDNFTKSSRKFLSEKVIIAGGINVENVKSIIEILNPYGVDVSSGLEKREGIKNKDLISEFFDKLRENCFI